MKKFILILLVGFLLFIFAPPIKASPKIAKQNIEYCKFIQKQQPEILVINILKIDSHIIFNDIAKSISNEFAFGDLLKNVNIILNSSSKFFINTEEKHLYKVFSSKNKINKFYFGTSNGGAGVLYR